MNDTAIATYALLLPDGKWARISSPLSHGQQTEHIAPAELQGATVMPRHRWRKWEKYGALVEVVETRVVSVVTGIGADKAATTGVA